MVTSAVLEVESIAAGGDGVARSDGLVVFIPRSAPGDSGLVTYSKRGAFARGKLVRIERASAARVIPRCEHFEGDRCGGCQLQHIAYEQQLQAKQRIVVDALQRIGGRGGQLVTMHRSADEWRYRRKLTLAFRREATGWIAGLHRYDDAFSVFSLRDCLITQRQVLDVFNQIRENGELLPAAKSLRISVLALPDGAHVTVGGGRQWDSAAALGNKCDLVRSIWWIREKTVAPPTASGSARARASVADAAETRALLFSRGGDSPGASFAQVNPAVAARMSEHVAATVLGFAPQSVVDLFCGRGETTLAIARGVGRIVGIDADADAVRAFSALLPPNARALAARAEDALPSELPADVVLLNPPRDGVDARVTATLANPGAVRRAIVYTSCNPATLARDVARLPGFAITQLDCFDMFPQTAHIETVCVLVPENVA